jgi:hypothetical protein
MTFLPDLFLSSVQRMVSKDGHFCKNCVQSLQIVIFTSTSTYTNKWITPLYCVYPFAVQRLIKRSVSGRTLVLGVPISGTSGEFANQRR